MTVFGDYFCKDCNNTGTVFDASGQAHICKCVHLKRLYLYSQKFLPLNPPLTQLYDNHQKQLEALDLHKNIYLKGKGYRRDEVNYAFLMMALQCNPWPYVGQYSFMDIHTLSFNTDPDKARNWNSINEDLILLLGGFLGDVYIEWCENMVLRLLEERRRKKEQPVWAYINNHDYKAVERYCEQNYQVVELKKPTILDQKSARLSGRVI